MEVFEDATRPKKWRVTESAKREDSSRLIHGVVCHGSVAFQMKVTERLINAKNCPKILLAICRPAVVSGVVVVVVVVGVGVCNRSQMRTSKCTCLIFGVSIGLDPG